ncbi:MAG: AMP-binding protein [Candidatus Aminicenantes bacterium]|nr:MAG: AMP-binding protein [Candidatus Aminicenantes bacterium]
MKREQLNRENNSEQPGYWLETIADELQLTRTDLWSEVRQIKEERHKERTIIEWFEKQVEKTPDNTAVIGPGRCASFSFLGLNQESNRLAHLLREKEVQSNSIVGILQEPSIEMIVAILAVLKAGGAYLPIDPGTPKNQLLTILDNYQVSLLLTTTDILKNHSITRLQNSGINVNMEPVITDNRPQIRDFDRLPFPDRSLVDYEKYNRFIGEALVKHCISLQATRGCPYHCAYCHKIWPKTHVVRSAENLFKEVQIYYDMGVRRFAFIDDIFNLNQKNSARFFELVIKNKLDVQFIFPNGLRGDRLTTEYIDLMMEAGTMSVALALETASPRLQRLIGKNLHLGKLKENIHYFIEKYPHIILELYVMLGFPGETEEEAITTLNFVKGLQCLHFVYVAFLKIYPNTDMEQLCLESGISREVIENSQDLAFHETPGTLPFDKNFALKWQADFLYQYFLSRERLLQVLPHQMRLLTRDEIIQKYSSYLSDDIKNFQDLLDLAGIQEEELAEKDFLDESAVHIPDFNKKLKKHFQAANPPENNNALRILLLDLSQSFSQEKEKFSNMVEPPLGLMYLMTFLKQKFGKQINGKIAKSRIDFDSFSDLKQCLDEFKPHVIGIRTLSFYRNFFHITTAALRQWGVDVPIIAGGPYATCDYPVILQTNAADLVVLGEGEITFSEVIEKIMENQGKLPGEAGLKDIPGIAFISKQTGQKQKNQPQMRQILMTDLLKEQLSHQPTDNPKPIPCPQNLAYINVSFDLKGKPNSSLTSHANISGRVKNIDLFAFSENDKILQLSPYIRDGFIFETFTAFANGAMLVIPGQEKEVAEMIKKKGITVLFITTALSNTVVVLQVAGVHQVREIWFAGQDIPFIRGKQELPLNVYCTTAFKNEKIRRFTRELTGIAEKITGHHPWQIREIKLYSDINRDELVVQLPGDTTDHSAAKLKTEIDFDF